MSSDKKSVVDSVDELRAGLQRLQEFAERERGKTKKLVEALMRLAELPGRPGVIASQAVEEWLKP